MGKSMCAAAFRIRSGVKIMPWFRINLFVATFSHYSVIIHKTLHIEHKLKVRCSILEFDVDKSFWPQKWTFYYWAVNNRCLLCDCSVVKFALKIGRQFLVNIFNYYLQLRFLVNLVCT